MTARRRLALLATGVALGAGCRGTKSQTAVVVDVTSDLRVPAQLDQVRVTATKGDGTQLYQQSFPLAGAAAHALPLRVALIRVGGETGPFRVTAEGLLGQTVAASQSAKLSFIPDHAVLLQLALLSACVGRTCPADQTCGTGGTCRSDTVDPGGLPPYTPGADAGAGNDAGSDAATGGDTGTDRTTTPDGGTDTTTPPRDAPTDTPGVDTRVDAGGGDTGNDGGPMPPDAGADASVDLNAGLVAYWAFDQAATDFPDYSGNTGNAARLGGGTWTATGATGGGVDLTSVGANLSVADSASIKTITSAVTIATWIRPLGPFGSIHNVLNRTISGGELALDFSDLGALRFTLGPRVMQTGTAVGNMDRWMHIAATYDGNFGRLYVDGEQVISNMLTAVPLDGFGTGILIGTRVDINYLPYNDLSGMLDEFTIYNRALNAAEVFQLASKVFPARR